MGNYLQIINFLTYRPRDAIAAIIKRLAHRNANVQLYSLTVTPAEKSC